MEGKETFKNDCAFKTFQCRDFTNPEIHRVASPTAPSCPRVGPSCPDRWSDRDPDRNAPSKAGSRCHRWRGHDRELCGFSPHTSEKTNFSHLEKGERTFL